MTLRPLTSLPPFGTVGVQAPVVVSSPAVNAQFVPVSLGPIETMLPRNSAPLTITTSLTVEYAEGWGTERIALDGVQNHLPSDSKGRNVFVEFRVDGAWISLTDRHRIGDRAVEAIRFRDDGIGFTYEKLELLFSGKRGDSSAVGQFGEGLKMITAACLRQGMGLEIRSRDWQAVPFVRHRWLDGVEAGQVCYEVSRSEETLSGSETMIRGPVPELVRCILDLESKVLPLRRGYKPLFRCFFGEAVDASGRLFVKGVHVSDAYQGKLVFGYNLPVALNRDRNAVDPKALSQAVGMILRRLDDPAHIQKFLAAACGQQSVEFEAMDPSSWNDERQCWEHDPIRHPQMWRQAFCDLFGDKAVLGLGDLGFRDNRDAERLARLMGYRVVTLPQGLRKALLECDVPSAANVVGGEDDRLFKYEEFEPDRIRQNHIESGITIDYRAHKWRDLRIVLDLLANHMPEDSGGSALPKIEYLVKETFFPEPRWVLRSDHRTNGDIQAIRFRDDGRGYDSETLGVFFSTKRDAEGAVGQFGEGLVMASAAVLRLQKENPDLHVKFRSRDWAAVPFGVEARIEGRETQKVFYKRAEGLTFFRGSQTTIVNPTSEMLEIVDRLEAYALAFRPSVSKPLFETEVGSIFDGGDDSAPKGTVFVNGFRLTDAFADNLLFSYDLRTRSINPDRDFADPESVRAGVRDLLGRCGEEVVISEILKAGKDCEKDFFEFQTVSFDASNEELKALYKTLFYDAFGREAVLYTGNPSVFAEATHRGFTPVKMPFSLQATLESAGIPIDLHVLGQGFVPSVVDPRGLTSAESEVLKFHETIDAVLGLKRSGPPLVFDELHLTGGSSEETVLGYYDLKTGQVYVRRDQLSHVGNFTETYIHEKGHEETGARDSEDRFRQFFERLLADYVSAEIRGLPRVATTWAQRNDRANLKDQVLQLQIALRASRQASQDALEEKERLTAENKRLQEENQRLKSLPVLQDEEDVELKAMRDRFVYPWWRSLIGFFGL